MTLRRVVCVTALALAACPGRLDDPDRFRACMLNVEADIFKPKCALVGCHSMTSPMNGLDLESPNVSTRLAGVMSMCQGKPLTSFMVEKLGAAPACGSSMPLGDPLTGLEVKCVRDYLASLVDGGT